MKNVITNPGSPRNARVYHPLSWGQELTRPSQDLLWSPTPTVQVNINQNNHHDHWSSRSSPYLTSSAALSLPSWHWHGLARTFCHHKHKVYRSPSRLSWSSFWSSSSYLHDHLNYHHQHQVLYRSPTINHHNHLDYQHRCHHYHNRAMITLDRINYFKLQSSPTPTVPVTSKIYDFKLVEQVMVTSC